MKINYKFNIKKGIGKPIEHVEALDEFDVKVKEFIANEFFEITTADRVEAIVKSKDNKIIQIIGNDDTFSKLNYKKGYVIETLLITS